MNFLCEAFLLNFGEVRMPRKLTESAKKRRKEKKQLVIEKPTDVPDYLKQSNFSTVPAKEIIDFTGTAKMTVYDCINRIKETGSSKPKPRIGRPLTATSKENVIKAHKTISKNPEVSNRACKEIEKLQAVEVSFETSLGVHYG